MLTEEKFLPGRCAAMLAAGMVRQIFGVIAGYVVAAGSVRLAQGILYFMIFPPFEPGRAAGVNFPPAYFVSLLVFAVAAAILGGRLAISIADTPSMPRYVALAILALGAITAIVDQGRQPLWFGALLPVAGAAVAYVSATRALRDQASSL